MRWNISESKDGYKAIKDNGLAAFVRRTCPLAFQNRAGGPGYDITYKGLSIAVIYFDHKGATVKALQMLSSFPEISDLDLVEIAMRLNNLRSAREASLN